MGMAADLFLGVGIKGLSEFSSDMDKMHGKVKEFGDQAEETKGKGGGLFDMMGGGVGKALGLATGIGTLLGVGGGLVGMFKDGIDQSNQWNDQMAQLDAVMKSTGGSAGVTKDQVTGLASSLSAANGLSKYADDAVLSGENLLLTFTNIGGNVFPAATQAMLDMSTKMGGDASSSAIQLGKALNDPEKGLTALVKVGVSFTQQQKDQIKAMQDAGNMAGAQQVILKELGNEFGGSAAASAKTFTGIMTTVSEKFHNVTQSIGDAAMPLLTRFADFLGSDAFMGTLQGIADMLVNGITAGINFFSDAI
ncbi:MAG: phage tail length tape measure family protein, partial [Chloroflexi bacterium]|nr:phage tail length tape measure family protein [Chloroflexota bacterium]